MRTMTAMLLLVLAPAFAADDANKKDMAALEGEWTMVSATSDGKDAPEDRVKQMTRTVKDGVSTLKLGDEVVAVAKFTIDPSKKPKTIDAKFNEGANKDQEFLGIYEIDGDTLKICVGMPGEERPKEFTAKEGSKRALSVWKKKGEKKEK